MKKIASMIMTAVLSLAIGVSAMAATEGTEATQITAKKVVTLSGATNEVFPNETLTFESTQDKNNPDDTNLTIGLLEVGADSLKEEGQNITINVPPYTKAGVYRYTIKEVEGDTQGVTYDTENTINVAVLVSYDDKNDLKVENVGIEVANAGDTKNETFTNQYDLGTLTVTKTVTGNLGDKNRDFKFKVTFTSANTVRSTISVSDRTDISGGWSGEKTYEFTLKDKGTATFSDIPVGVSYVVEEIEKTKETPDGVTKVDNATDDPNDKDAYKVTSTGESGEITKKNREKTAAFTNAKSQTINTGIILDNAPYILILAAVVAAVIVMVMRRRRVID